MDVKEKAGMVTDVKVDMKVNEYIYMCESESKDECEKQISGPRERNMVNWKLEAQRRCRKV